MPVHGNKWKIYLVEYLRKIWLRDSLECANKASLLYKIFVQYLRIYKVHFYAASHVIPKPMRCSVTLLFCRTENWNAEALGGGLPPTSLLTYRFSCLISWGKVRSGPCFCAASSPQEEHRLGQFGFLHVWVWKRGRGPQGGGVRSN